MFFSINLYNPVQEKHFTQYHYVKPELLINQTLKQYLLNVRKDFDEYIDRLENTQGSGLIFEGIEYTLVKFYKIKSIIGKGYQPLPFKSTFIVNIQNEDNFCFIYCIIAHFIIKQNPKLIHKEKVSHYNKLYLLNKFFNDDYNKNWYI